MSLNEQQRKLVEWARQHLQQAFGGDVRALAAEMGYSETVLIKLFGADGYDGDAAAVCDAIAKLRQREMLSQRWLIETPVSERIRDALNYAESTQTLVAISGQTGTSKTITSCTWAREKSRRLYVQVPSICLPYQFDVMLCQAAGIETDEVPIPKLQQQLLKPVSKQASLARKTLIVDDAGFLLKSGKGIGLGAFGRIKDICDLVRCGLVIIMEDWQWEELTNGKNKRIYAQTVGRISYHVHIPKPPVVGEVDAIVNEFFPHAPADLIREARDIMREPERLRPLLDDLKKATWLASKDNRAMTLKDLQKARRNRRSGTELEIDKAV